MESAFFVWRGWGGVCVAFVAARERRGGSVCDWSGGVPRIMECLFSDAVLVVCRAVSVSIRIV